MGPFCQPGVLHKTGRGCLKFFVTSVLTLIYKSENSLNEITPICSFIACCTSVMSMSQEMSSQLLLRIYRAITDISVSFGNNNEEFGDVDNCSRDISQSNAMRTNLNSLCSSRWCAWWHMALTANVSYNVGYGGRVKQTNLNGGWADSASGHFYCLKPAAFWVITAISFMSFPEQLQGKLLQ